MAVKGDETGKDRINYAVGRVTTTLEELVKTFEKADDTVGKDSVLKVFGHLSKLFINAQTKAALSLSLSKGFDLDDPIDETDEPIVMPATATQMVLGPRPVNPIAVFDADGRPEGRLIGQGKSFKRPEQPHPLETEGANDFLDDD